MKSEELSLKVFKAFFIANVTPFLLSAFLIFLFSIKNSAFAQNTVSQYTINDIVAEGSGASPTQARTKAINSGQRNAFTILLDRLGVDKTATNKMDDEAISDMVASQQIINEKIAGNNYSATLNLSFSESFVKHYLEKQSISLGDKTEIKSISYLIIPVKLLKTKPLIWEENNDWKTTWESMVESNNTTFLKTAKGDAEDISKIKSDNLENITFDDVSPILSKYKAGGMIVAYFDFDSLENKVDITLQTTQKSSVNKIRLDFVNVNQLKIQDLMEKVASRTMEYINNNIINTPTTDPKSLAAILLYQIDVNISDLSEWLKIKNKLENSNLVSQFKIESISRDLVKIKISYNSSNGDIVNFFAGKGLFLQKNSDTKYSLGTINNPQTKQ